MATPEKCEAVINEMKPLIDSLSKRIESLEVLFSLCYYLVTRYT